jgi:hypothetical protein
MLLAASTYPEDYAVLRTDRSEVRLYPTESRTKESRSTYYSGLRITLCGKVTLTESEERGARAMPISNAHELFVHKLGTIYDAEHQFVEGQQEEQTARIAEQSAPELLHKAI